MSRRTIPLLFSGLVAGTALVACTPPHNSDITWQINEVYLDPATPASLPGDVTATMVMGGATVTGDTGCAAYQGRVKFDNLDDPHSVTFSTMRFQETQCIGAQRYFHDALVTLLDGEFAVTKTDKEMRLTKQPAGLDAPSIRLVATQ
ncbi:META domain-containing protein [Corynebacterium epidermidicanis]|uniref:META domain protein n=1 Tax=Corynebacterium epidermidicanis TaxID=1050174 RepID=A0A0G3GS47_9CORY|nr:META domain-containing protein [Corynebacterium epidermidicanis]AKK03949.1 META domain protein [Corynebacterium epidermidicanis]